MVALYLASQAARQVDDAFTKFTQQLIKQVRETQDDVALRTDRVRNDFQTIGKSIESIEKRALDHGEKINTLTQRITVLEHELTSLTESIPPQFRRAVPKKKSNNAP